MGFKRKCESSMPLAMTTSLSRSGSSVEIQDTSARSLGRSSEGAFSRVTNLGSAGSARDLKDGIERQGLGVLHGQAERAFGIVGGFEEVHKRGLGCELVWLTVPAETTMTY